MGDDIVDRIRIAETAPLDADGKVSLFLVLNDARAEIERLRFRVAELDQQIRLDDRWATLAPDRNAGDVSNQPDISSAGKQGESGKQEPVKYAVVVGGKMENFVYDDSWAARHKASMIACRGTPRIVGVVALYAAPQPPRGWLTRHERWRLGEMVAWLKGRAAEHPDTIHGGLCESYAADIDALLARSTPLRVRRPRPTMVGWDTIAELFDCHDAAWIAAIREAGGEVEG